MSSVTLSEKHGVNPGLENCFICNQPKGVILYGQIGNKVKKAVKSAGLEVDSDGQAPNGLILDEEPCTKCAEHMKNGVILVSVRKPSNKEEEKNPYRTGGWVVVRDEAIQRMVQPAERAESILKKRMAFVPDEAWDLIGLPRGEVEGVPSE